MIILPWHNPILSPNARKHWKAKMRPKATARADAFHATRASGYSVAPRIIDKLDVAVTHCPPDKRRRDLDNCIASFKHAQDGIAEALGMDDSRFRVTHEFGEPVKGGKIVVVLA